MLSQVIFHLISEKSDEENSSQSDDSKSESDNIK